MLMDNKKEDEEKYIVDWDLQEWSAVFIDGGYLDKIKDKITKQPHYKLDLECLSDILAKPYRRLRTYYYNAYPYQSPEPTENERHMFSQAQKFYDKISKLKRFEVRLGKLVKRISENGTFYYIQKGVDVYFAVDLLKVSWSKNVKYIILVAGDNDFVPAIKAAKESGVIIKLWYEKDSKPGDLINAVDESYILSEKILEKCHKLK